MLNIKLHTVVNATPSELSKINQAIKFLKERINSQDFKNFVLNFTYKGIKKFTYTNLTNQQVYDKILSGVETLHPEVDNEMDIWLSVFNSTFGTRNTIGYTYPNVDTQYINRKFLSTFTYPQVAMNLTHEICHKDGFDHPYEYTKERDYSVPYSIGYFFNTNINKSFNGVTWATETSNVFCEHREKGFFFDKVLSK